MTKPLNRQIAALPTTIFTVMSELARAHDAINLGQGFPDTEGPQDMVQVAADALLDGRNQYAPLTGLPELRRAVADSNARFQGLEIDAESEVVVTSGATEALAAALMALIEPGDDVVLIEPLYDTYLPMVRQLGGIPRLVRLQEPGWTLPREALAAAFSARTKAILLNTPMNPTGKVFTTEELDFIASLLRQHDAYAVCDEVYEHLTFNTPHVSLMSRPDMRERCLRIGSAGKSFSLTGWKVGYVTAPAPLAAVVAKAHQNLVFATAPNLQRAVAFGLNKDDQYFQDLAADMARKRDILSAGLRSVGLEVLPCDGSYFVMADITPLANGLDDVAFARQLTEEAGVTTIPASAFYDPANGTPPKHLVRFAFCKQDAVLQDAVARIKHWASQKDG
ncbi:aminotransferase [Acetobacter orleanensis]|uniref:Aminotransferase n=1 Tax=Acetobacter orleanensis TaxID=104099 RepID=A0A4Y3TMX9_9PROT|nr:aminotransferase [Acetobacter orleanensis]KXV66826.1 aminotransferase [Acetobacter orleanensis]PCD79612.1 aminotransferase [Acetobacter orleanensis]GAN68706.1 transaminase [Acetobacter orleanensis JCM 7639]GBR24611.1 transaminase [Acetobacter orleanensis NRIC 0473]GEB82320.1 aminotransferase [Acetobacter orleanensis]